MLISFFEEFPDDDTLSKVSLISFPSKLYLAAKSVSEFEKIKSKISNKNIIKIIYWPILSKDEGYWISPFSQRQALERVFSELKNKKTPIMLDLEYPITRNASLLFTQFFNFLGNKNKIKKFIENSKGEIYTVAYSSDSSIFSFLGLNYKNLKINHIKMYYHSMHGFNETLFRKKLQVLSKKFGNRFIPGLGLLAAGIHGNEPVLKVKELERDLSVASEEGIKEVVLFRLGGLDKEYLKVIRKFSN